jgi:spore germination cell wall hydrolase CwlJ-like protein
MLRFLIAATVVFLTVPVSAYSTENRMNILFSPELNPEAWCLAQNIYYEARSSNLADQLAVADVVINRVNDTRFPNTVCKVVKQGRYNSKGQPVRNQCQFSWWCDGKSDYPRDYDAWANAQQRAYMMLELNEFRGISEGATHYHANYVSPRWANSFAPVGRIGEHVFYRWER